MPDLKVTIRQLESRRGRAPDLGFEATLENATDREVLVRLPALRAPSLVFEVETAEREFVPLGPPPLPPREEKDRLIGPGDHVVIGYRGFLDRTLVPGRYRIRFHATYPLLDGEPDDPLESEWLDFEVREEIPAVPEGGFHHKPWYERIWELILRILERIFKWTCRRTFSGAVDEARTQTITTGSKSTCAGGATEAAECASRVGLYSWHAAFDLRLSESACRADVTVRISWKKDPAAAYDPNLTYIAGKITQCWDDRFRLCHDGDCCPEGGYRIRVAVVFVHDAPADAHHDVTFGNQTTDMHVWSTAGLYVDHEFGHMLGPADEYCTVDGVAHCAPNLGTNIMNASSRDCEAVHFEWIRTKAESLLGGACTVIPKAYNCPGAPPS